MHILDWLFDRTLLVKTKLSNTKTEPSKLEKSNDQSNAKKEVTSTESSFIKALLSANEVDEDELDDELADELVELDGEDPEEDPKDDDF